MADQIEIGRWVIRNADLLDLHVQKLNWVGFHFPGQFDIAANIDINGRPFFGRGTASNSDTALVKAVVESIERSICSELNISSIGVAGHTILSEAQENAKFEFIERDLIHFHFKNNIPMTEISEQKISIRPLFQRNLIFKIHAFSMQAPNNLYGIFVLAESIDSGVGGFMGAAVASSQSEALMKAKIECFRNLFAYEEHYFEPITKAKFDLISSPSAEESRGLLLNQKYCQNLLNIFKNNTGNEQMRYVQPLTFNYSTLELPKGLPGNCPLKFVRCLDQNGEPAPDCEFVG